MVPSPNTGLSEIWTELFVAVSNIRYHVSRERSVDATSNVKLQEFRRITENVVEIAKVLSMDTKLHGLDAPSVEYFIENDIGGTLVSLAIEDIPAGLLSLMIGLYTALLSTLPPAFFINDRICTSLRELIGAVHTLVENQEAELYERIILLLESLAAQVHQYPLLKLVLLPDQLSTDNFYTIISRLIDHDVNMSGLKELVEKGLESGLISGPESERIVVSIVFSLVKIFSNGTNLQFKSHFQFVQRCQSAAKEDSTVPSLLITAYRDNFVDRIFAAAVKGSSSSDESLGVLLDILTDLSESDQSSELFMPLLSKSVRLLDYKQFNEDDRLIILYGQALSSKTLFRCFPTRRPKTWTESVTVHRKRLDHLLSSLPNLGLGIFRSAGTVSNLYRIHLLTMEKLLGEDLAVYQTVPEMIPQIKEQSLVLEMEKLSKISSIIAKIKTRLSDFWNRGARTNLLIMRFVAGCFTFLDAGLFYAELVETDPNSFVSCLMRTMDNCPKVIPDESLIESMLPIHMQHDSMDPSKWDTAVFVKDLVAYRTANIYVLGHVIMRLAAMAQVRATREATCIVYD